MNYVLCYVFDEHRLSNINKTLKGLTTPRFRRYHQYHPCCPARPPAISRCIVVCRICSSFRAQFHAISSQPELKVFFICRA